MLSGSHIEEYEGNSQCTFSKQKLPILKKKDMEEFSFLSGIEEEGSDVSSLEDDGDSI